MCRYYHSHCNATVSQMAWSVGHTVTVKVNDTMMIIVCGDDNVR